MVVTVLPVSPSGEGPLLVDELTLTGLRLLTYGD
jgi:hypothetical protein